MHVRRVDISLVVGTTVMFTVMRGPPQRTLLQRQAAQRCAQKLEPPRRLKGAVGKIAMVKGCQPEGAGYV
jgi:hypothetical protein